MRPYRLLLQEQPASAKHPKRKPLLVYGVETPIMVNPRKNEQRNWYQADWVPGQFDDCGKYHEGYFESKEEHWVRNILAWAPLPGPPLQFGSRKKIK